MRRALYAFSGDPITNGHLDVIKRASSLYDELLVAIGNNSAKRYLFTQAERVAMAQQATAVMHNVKVVGFTGLLVDFAWEQGVSVIVRGLRNREDFEYEQTFAQLCTSQQLPLELVYLLAKPELAHISSSAVKELQINQGMLQDYVPVAVKQQLEERLSEQQLLGITGEIGAGKSYVAQKIQEVCAKIGRECHIVELDVLGHEILTSLSEPQYESVRQKIIAVFGKKVRSSSGAIDRQQLGKLVFADAQEMNKLNAIMYQPLLVRLRRHLFGKKGLILLVAALTAELNIASLTNNRVLLVTRERDAQRKSLAARDLDAGQIDRRLASQWNTETKREKLLAVIESQAFGHIWEVANESSNELDAQIGEILQSTN